MRTEQCATRHAHAHISCVHVWKLCLYDVRLDFGGRVCALHRVPQEVQDVDEEK